MQNLWDDADASASGTKWGISVFLRQHSNTKPSLPAGLFLRLRFAQRPMLNRVAAPYTGTQPYRRTSKASGVGHGGVRTRVPRGSFGRPTPSRRKVETCSVRCLRASGYLYTSVPVEHSLCRSNVVRYFNTSRICALRFRSMVLLYQGPPRETYSTSCPRLHTRYEAALPLILTTLFPSRAGHSIDSYARLTDGGSQALATRANAQHLVTTRLLECLHDPVARPSRMQGSHPGAQ